jgi:A/G-specific adenine glycosylase
MNNLIPEFRQCLLDWGSRNTLAYPWRWLDDPYRVLVSEFMLHRTQTKQVIGIYQQFIALCPTLEISAQTDVSRMRGTLLSLGLRWRTDAMLRALSHLWQHYGDVPLDRQKLMSVEGIGPYIADATICFTQDQPVALIDTNTVRVIGRVFGLDLRGEARRRKTVIEGIAAACDPDHPRDYYYALIDFAHQICTPRIPDCANCPLFDLPCAYGNTTVKSAFQGDTI